jgi:hypothetical protein
MPLEINIAVDAAVAERKLGVLAGPALRAALVEGLNEAAEIGAGRVVTEARAKGLAQRTGSLLGSVAAWPDAGDPLTRRIGVPEDSPAARYAYLLTAESRDIRPVNAKALAIPFGDNLTGAGVARYPTPRDLVAAFGEQNVFFGKRTIGVTGSRFRSAIYFVLSFGVTVRGRDVIDPALTAATADMTTAVQAAVDGLTQAA